MLEEAPYYEKYVDETPRCSQEADFSPQKPWVVTSHGSWVHWYHWYHWYVVIIYVMLGLLLNMLKIFGISVTDCHVEASTARAGSLAAIHGGLGSPTSLTDSK